MRLTRSIIRRRKPGLPDQWQRDLAEQAQEDAAMKRDVEALLDRLDPDDPAAVTVREVFEQFEAWYFTFAKRHARRLGTINTTIRRLIRMTFAALLLVAVILIGVGVMSYLLTSEQGDQARQSHHLAVQATRLAYQVQRQAQKATRLAHQIQAQRRLSLLRDCRRDNMHYAKAIALLDSVRSAALDTDKTPTQRAATQQGYVQFKTLISILAPPHLTVGRPGHPSHPNCLAYVKGKAPHPEPVPPPRRRSS
jgi:type II secretory pathway pseudopilin PulG